MLGKKQHQVYGYTVDNIFYNSKIRALSAAGGDIKKIKLYFNDEEWKHVDWTKEPTHTFKQLVDMRCRQLRNNYKFLTLFFSGGYDSTTILNGFIRNNLLIDEIVVWDRVWARDYMKSEIDSALVIAKTLKRTIWPRLKITHWQHDPKDTEQFYLKHRNNWIEHASDHITSQKLIRNYQMEADASVFRLHEKKDNVLIEGRDKPRVDLRDGKWYAMMNDKLLKFSMNNNADQFYYSPHFPELYIKQCHMAINWIEKYCMNFSHQQVHEFMSFQMTPDLYKKYNMEGLERDPIPHNATGAGGLCKFIMLNGIKGVDSRALESIMDPYAIKLWQGGINEIRREFPTAWNQDVNELHTVVNEGRYLRDFKPHVR